jgi:polysaccharide deacetylase family protein (PEP-CTERM system associated)
MTASTSSLPSTNASYTPVTSSFEHIFTVDVEDYFQVSAFDSAVSRKEWDSLPSRVGPNVDRLLDLLEAFQAKATFFTLGWVAARHPRVVQRIALAGHEIASHSWWHFRVTKLTPTQFRQEARSSKAILEEVSGQPVIGFRAPSFSIRRGMEWAFDVLVEEGYRYDSSLFPIRRPDYGYPGIPDTAYRIERPSGQLIELPLTTTTWLGARLPAGGGAYLRHLPMQWTRRAFSWRALHGAPAVLYVHPWEVDPDQPRMRVSALSRFRHYTGLTKTMPRLQQLLGSYSFTTAANSLGLRTFTTAVTPPIDAIGVPSIKALAQETNRHDTSDR